MQKLRTVSVSTAEYMASDWPANRLPARESGKKIPTGAGEKSPETKQVVTYEKEKNSANCAPLRHHSALVSPRSPYTTLG